MEKFEFKPGQRAMLLEHAILHIKPGASKAFETAFQEAQGVISSQKGYLRHELQHCVAQQDQ